MHHPDLALPSCKFLRLADVYSNPRRSLTLFQSLQLEIEPDVPLPVLLAMLFLQVSTNHLPVLPAISLQPF